MKTLRKLIFKLLGLEGYLKLVSKTYLSLVRNGFLKGGYPELFFLEKIVQPGYVCIDIGANVGYYSDRLTGLVGDSGHVHAVEPIPLFAKVWQSNVRHQKRATLHNVALGDQPGQVEMGIPMRNGMIRHGMTKIAHTENEDYYRKFDVTMAVPDELFAKLERLDFVKCDVEGFESVVFGHMQGIIEKFRPMVQSELSGHENRKKVIDLFRKLNYQVLILDHAKGVLTVASEEQCQTAQQDFYFQPND